MGYAISGREGELIGRFRSAASVDGFYDELKVAEKRRAGVMARLALATALCCGVVAATFQAANRLGQPPSFSQEDSRTSLEEVTAIIDDLSQRPLEDLVRGE